jgi:hypothetical protein
MIPDKIQSILKARKLSLHPVMIPLLENKYTKKSFENFLIEDRFRPMQRLMALQELSTMFNIGYEKVSLWHKPYDSDKPSKLTKDFGRVFLNTEFSSEEVFQCLLARFGFLQVIAADRIQRAFQSEYHSYESHELSLEAKHELLISPLIIIAEDAIYADKSIAENIAEKINLHNKEFEDLLRKCENGVPHVDYISWFLKWFPGRVHIRSLSDLRIN